MATDATLVPEFPDFKVQSRFYTAGRQFLVQHSSKPEGERESPKNRKEEAFQKGMRPGIEVERRPSSRGQEEAKRKNKVDVALGEDYFANVDRCRSKRSELITGLWH